MFLAGRENEQHILTEFLQSNRPEFLAIYGRRRVGKTFLIRQFFQNRPIVFFNTTGAKEAPLSEQINHFTQEIGKVFYHGAELKPGKNWDQTFELLSKAIDSVPKHKKIVLFLDELPWMATKKYIKKGLSAAENIEALAFRKKSLLLNEFDNIFASLFYDHELSVEMVRIMSQYIHGISQKDLFKKLGKNVKGKSGLTRLKELEDAGFIISFIPHFHHKKGIYYKLIDEYTLFYFQWIEPVKTTLIKRNLTAGYWEKQQNSAAWHSWSGLAFESICYKHLPQISAVLKLGPTAVPNTWRYQPKPGSIMSGVQIDLLFDRKDDAITICEIKYTDSPFVIDKSYAQKLAQKVEIFKKITGTHKQIFLAVIAPAGLKKNLYSEEFADAVVTLDDFFKKMPLVQD